MISFAVMIIKTAQFTCSYATVTKCPDSSWNEYAFIGRSNVGKSSLINYVTNYNDLAKVSSTPGKTQLINFFDINEAWYLVDLPGYGFAKVSKKDREIFDKMIRAYLKNRLQLQYVFVLVDSRIAPQKIDLEFINWLGEHGIPFAIVFTKKDVSRKRSAPKNIEAFKNAMLEQWEELPPMFETSAFNRVGKEDILAFIGANEKESAAIKKSKKIF
jgi:GTP-binding protein